MPAPPAHYAYVGTNRFEDALKHRSVPQLGMENIRNPGYFAWRRDGRRIDIQITNKLALVVWEITTHWAKAR